VSANCEKTRTFSRGCCFDSRSKSAFSFASCSGAHSPASSRMATSASASRRRCFARSSRKSPEESQRNRVLRAPVLGVDLAARRETLPPSGVRWSPSRPEECPRTSPRPCRPRPHPARERRATRPPGCRGQRKAAVDRVEEDVVAQHVPLHGEQEGRAAALEPLEQVRPAEPRQSLPGTREPL